MTFSVSVLSFSRLRGLKAASLSAALMLGLTIAGCASTGSAPTTAAQRVDQAVAQVTDALVSQTQSLSGMLDTGRRGVVLDPMIDANSGQQTVSTQLLQGRVSERGDEQLRQLEEPPWLRLQDDLGELLAVREEPGQDLQVNAIAVA